jgi:hypothetical protein
MRRSSIGYLVILALLGLLGASCGGGGGDGNVVNPGLSVRFTDSGTPSAQDLVRLTGTPTGGRVAIQVVLAGPTTSDDVASFAFDVAIGDPSVLAFGDVQAVAGPALATPGCLDPTVLARQRGDRVVVGVAKLGCAGNGLPAGEQTIVTLSFRALQPGTSTLTLAGSPAIPGSPAGEPAAFDSGTVKIDSIRFDDLAATVHAM